MMFRVHLNNYLVKMLSKCIRECCIRIREILCILKYKVMIYIYENKAYFMWVKTLYFIDFSLIVSFLSLCNQNGLQMINIDHLIQMHPVLIIFSVTTLAKFP